MRTQLLPAVLIAGLSLLVGCVSADNRGHSAPPTPSEATPGRVALTVGDFVDTDDNRYRDSTTVVAYIYAASSDYPIPMKVRGSFTFRLEDKTGATIAEWTFDERQTAEAQRDLAPGPGYAFTLSLVGNDRREQNEAQLVCAFSPTKGQPIRTRAAAVVLVGPVGRSGLSS
jgi:hypothetical protein